MKKNTIVGITFDATMNIKDATNSIEEMGRHFEILRKQMPQGLSKRFKSDLEELEAEMKSFKDISSDLETIGDVSALKNSSEKIAKLYKKIKEESSEIADLDLDSLMPKEILEKLASASKLTKAYKKDINALSDETEEYKKKIQDLINLKKEHQELARKKTAIGKTSVSDEDLVAAEQQKIKLGRDVDNAKLKGSGIDLSGKEFQTLLKQQREAASFYADLQDKARQYKKALSEVENELENNEKAQKKYQEISEKFGTTLKALENSLSNLGEDLKIEKFNKFKEELEEITDLDLSELKQDLSNLEEILGSLSVEQMEKISLAVEGLTENTKKLDKPLGAMKEGVRGVGEEAEKIATLSDEVDRLKNQVIDFFSIGNAIELFKRAISSAFETVKELDKTMTETAVVTDFTVGDMWKQLPLYSKNARDLGVSINAAYEATTLYYQQGLKTEEAMGVSNETLRMARIANIDAKDATDLMTAALRGFNMEVNAMNAQKVNDVFSKLAAVTAADTEEIGIAMSKTASIAESANMEFNTTAALLTQIIETTREAPETAGTAMKTIIARFTEVKKLMTAGQLTGTDEEGEVIDVNKIDTALKTVGLSLKGFMQGTEGIDDIFLKLAEKWDGLDISTQRYIATMAAGSRQQSRFLAMMGDYGRTMELVDAANTSAGASQEQFNKTLESMDAKLNKMKVAWDTFVMGIANNEIIKFFVDLLTGLLNAINGIINAISFDNGLIKSVLSLTAAILGLKVGFSIFNKLFDAIKESKGEAILKTLITNLKKTKAEAAVAGAATNKFSLSLITTKLSAMGATIATKVFGKAAVSTAMQIGIALGAIGLIIGAITLLIFGLTKLEQKMREKTPAGKLEAAKKEAEAAAEAAQEAADAYDNLNNSLISLEDKYADINKLTEGTREWTRSMQELNSEVLNLVDEYPKLARFVQNKGGVLTLDIASKEVQDVIDGYETEKKKTSIVAAATSGIEKRAGKDLAQEGLLENIHSYTFNKYDDEQVKAAAEKIAKGEIVGKQIGQYFAMNGMGAVNEDVLALFRQYGENQLQQDLENKDHFANLLLQLESLDFTSQLDAVGIDLGKLKVEDVPKLEQILLDSGITDKIINDNGGWESFIEQLAAAQEEKEKLAEERQTRALKKMPGKFKDLEELVSKDIEVIENLGSQVSVMGEDAGVAYIESFNEVLRGAKDPEALATYLSTVDPTNMNEITAAMEYMRTQGVDSSQIENFWNKITDGAGTYIDSLESILSLIDKWNKEQLNAEGIGSRLEEGKASTEDMLELTKAGVDLTDFDMTPEGWVGTEEAIKKATDALQDYYDLNQKRVLEQEKEQAAKNAENAFDGIYKSKGSFKIADSDLGAKTAGGNPLTTVDEITGKLVAGQVDTGVSKAVINALAGAGITVADKSAEETVDEFLSRLQTAYNSYISLLNNKEDIDIMITKFEEMKAEQEKIDQMKLSSAENISKGADPEIILGSLEREIGEEGFNTDEVKAYAKELTKANEKLGKTTEALDEVSALQSAFASTKSQKGLKEIVDSYDDWNSILDKTTGLLKDMSPKGVSTFNKLKESVNEMLNTSTDLSDKFWANSENIKLIREAANGSIEALSQLRKAATDDFLLTIKSDFETEEAKAEIEAFRVFLAGYKLPVLEAGAVLDDGPFIKALNNMITQTGLTTTQVQNLIKQMGFTATIGLVQKNVPGYWMSGPAFENDPFGEGIHSAKRPKIIKKWVPGYTYTAPQVSIKSLTSNVTPFRPSGGGGGSKGGSSGGGGGGGGSSSKPKKDTWENPYDDLYNLSEKVNKTIRDRNSLEREYDMILEDRTSSINELLANSLKQLANLRKEKALQGDILKTYQKRLKSAVSQEYLGTKTVDGEEEQFWTTFQREATRLGLGSLSSYASVNSETGEIAIDYSKIEAIENNTTSGEAQGALLTAFIGFLEETANSFIDTKETLFDISDQIDEIEKRGKEEYVEFEQSIYDAIVEREQAIIDEYQSLSEVISDSNSKILDSLQESISLERQIRDNTDTEENISDMESRLAYLRRDTSGANDAEIRQLEKDLSDARETYSDTLVDQELQRLSDVNEKAAEQRERQIELMQSQLDYAASNGAFWEEVSRMLESSINADGTLKATSELVDLLKVTDEFKALSYFGGKVWIDDLIQAWLVALEGKANLEEEYKTTPVTTTPTTTTPTTTKPTTTTPTTTTPTTSAPVQEVYTVKSGDTLSGIASAYNKKGFNTTYQKIGKDNAITNLNRIYAGQKLTIKKYKEGGLVDYTGPAWVDGTPGKPEAMLRAVDTQNFIELKEILADILKNPSRSSSKPSGDNYFDVDINVDSIANDYDVEKMASRVKEIINTDARYRNVNSINFLR